MKNTNTPLDRYEASTHAVAGCMETWTRGRVAMWTQKAARVKVEEVKVKRADEGAPAERVRSERGEGRRRRGGREACRSSRVTPQTERRELL